MSTETVVPALVEASTQAPIRASQDGAATTTTAGEQVQETVDFSSVGEDWKETKVSKATATAVQKLLKSEHFTPELAETLANNPDLAKLYFTNEDGYHKAHKTRFNAESEKIKTAEKRLNELSTREKSIADKEKELAEIEGDAMFHRDPKVKEARKYAEQQVAIDRWTQEEADAYLKPYVHEAKRGYEDRQKADQERLNKYIEENQKIGQELFPEFDSEISKCLVDGFVLGDRDARQAAEFFRAELNRMFQLERVKAVSEYLRDQNKQPTITDTKPAPVVPGQIPPPSVKDERVKLGMDIGKLFSGMRGS